MTNIWMLSPMTTVGVNTFPTCSAYATSWEMPWTPPAAGTPVNIAHVQDAVTISGSTITWGTATTAGNTIIVSARADTNHAAACTCSDSGGNTYVKIAETEVNTYWAGNYGSSTMVTFYSVTTTSTTTVTISGGYAEAGDLYVSAHEYSGIDSVHPTLETYGGIPQTAHGLPVGTTNVPTIAAGSMVFATVLTANTISGGTTVTLSGPTFTTRTGAGYVAGDSGAWHEYEYIPVSAGAVAITLAESGYNTYGAALLVFQPTVVATGMGLVFCQSTPTQITAAQADPTIVVLSTNYLTPIPPLVGLSYYTYGTVIGMDLGALLQLLNSYDSTWSQVDPTSITTAPILPLYNGGAVSGTGVAAPAANTIGLTPFILPYAVSFSNIVCILTGTDATNLHSLGIYSEEGELIVAVAPQVYPVTGTWFTGSAVLQQGLFYLAWTCNGTTTLQGNLVPISVQPWMNVGTTTLTSGATLPSTIVPPSGGTSGIVASNGLGFGLC